jgi:cysteinyl-tRNA synthetase
MQLGMIGLGRMGANMVRRLLRGGHNCVVFDRSQKAIEEFDAAMDDDFNTPRALATLIAYSKDIEAYAGRPVGKLSIERVVKTFDYFGGVFGILRSGAAPGSNVVAKLLEIILRMRDEARRKGDWATSDRLRDQVTKAGIGLEDTRGGTRWYIASSPREESR